MLQYTAIKKEEPNALHFFRIRKFNEQLFDDAVTDSRQLQITLHYPNKEHVSCSPMSGTDDDGATCEGQQQMRAREVLYASSLPLWVRAGGGRDSHTHDKGQTRERAYL